MCCKTRALLGALILILFGNSVLAGGNQVYWYVNGEKEVWNVDENVISFQIKESSGTLREIENLGAYELTGLYNDIISFKVNNTSSAARKKIAEDIGEKLNSGNPLILIRLPGAPITRNQDIFIDDRVLVGIRQNSSRSYLNYLIDKYELQKTEETSGEFGERGNFVYIFTVKNNNLESNSATVAAKMYEAERDFIAFAQPNRINLFSPNSVNDTDIDDAWHLENNGQPISCSSLYGTQNADAKITNVWDVGYTGQGIKVGIIDFYGFDYDHPDLLGQFLPGWDCINNTSYNQSNFYYTLNNQAHGTAVAGVVGAKGNNNQGSAGVAYGAKLVPFLIDGSEASVIIALQKTMSSNFDVDVINCSFGSYFASPAIEAEINNVTANGRVREGTTYGITVVASHGNDHYNDVSNPQYPSVYENVISVSASTPDDKKKTPGDDWETGSEWGTNYGSSLHLAAPGVCIYTTDFSGSDGYSSSDYIGFQKTSASAPIVSGVVALMLSKTPRLSWQEVMSRLTESADKVNASGNGGTYDYNANPLKPGQSIEMGYGRINAYKAVTNNAVGIAPTGAIESQIDIQINTIVQNELTIVYHSGNPTSNLILTVYDISGKQVNKTTLTNDAGRVNIDVGNIMPGIYLSTISDAKGNNSVTKRFVKLN